MLEKSGRGGIRDQSGGGRGWQARGAPLLTRALLSAAELLYSLQWCEELDNPPVFLTGFQEMLEKMNITYDNLCGLGNTSSLLRLLFNR